jgi:hypothetical protein
MRPRSASHPEGFSPPWEAVSGTVFWRLESLERALEDKEKEARIRSLEKKVTEMRARASVYALGISFVVTAALDILRSFVLK